MDARLLAAVKELRVSGRYLREALERADGPWEELISDIEAGMPADECARKFGQPSRRCSVSAQIDEFVSDRRTVRTLMVEQASEAGMTLTEYAELYGISRQQVRRLFRPPDRTG